MFLDDTQTHPMTAFLNFDLHGPVDPERMKVAFRETLKRHPMFCCHVSEFSESASWVEAPKLPEFRILDEGTPFVDSDYIDLRVETGLKGALVQKNGYSTLLFLTHHACTDGLGYLTFLFEFFAAYLGHELKPVDLSRLPSRECFKNARSSYSILNRAQQIVRMMIGQRPEPMRCTQSSQTQRQSPINTRGGMVTLNADEYSKLKRRAKEEKVSLNDWVVTAFMITVAKWNHEADQKKARYRIIVPVNRRPLEETFDTAMNKVGYKLLTRMITPSENFDSLLKNIHEEMNAVRDNRPGVFSFLKMLQFFKKTRLLKTLLKNNGTFASLVYSTLGNLSGHCPPWMELRDGFLYAGDIRLENFHSVPPRRRGTNASICTLGYGNEFHILSRCGHPQQGLSVEETDEFLEMYRVTLLESLIVKGSSNTL